MSTTISSFICPGSLDEALLHLLLELLDLVHRRVFRLVEVRREHLAVDVVLAQLLGQPFAGLLALDVGGRRPVGGDDRALARQIGLLEHLEEAAGRVDAAGDEQRVAVAALQPVARRHVHQDVGDDLLQPVSRAESTFCIVPQRCLSWALATSVSPWVLSSNHWSIFAWRGDVLVDVARLVAQVEHHAVAHRLVVLVGVDVRAEGLDAASLVVLEQRRAGEADQHRVRQQRLHRLVQLAGLGAVALVHEDEDLALGVEALGQVAS